MSALLLAALRGFVGCVNVLLGAGARLETPSKGGITPVMAAAKAGQARRVVVFPHACSLVGGVVAVGRRETTRGCRIVIGG